MNIINKLSLITDLVLDIYFKKMIAIKTNVATTGMVTIKYMAMFKI
jgi:hypothetical protein